MTSVRTIVRDAVAAQCDALKQVEGDNTPKYETSLRWLTIDEIKQSGTVCIVVTDEQRAPSSQQRDDYAMQVVTVCYARDADDPRAKLDEMIEDAIRMVLLAAEQLKQTRTIWKAVLDQLATDEGTTAAGPWAQAVLRWSCSHQRQAVLQ
jgi:hypothetical protein